MARTSEFCIHYQAMSSHNACKAGISYDTFKGLPFDKRPCFEKNGKAPGGCDKAEFPTLEQRKARDAEIEKHFNDVMTARAAIVAFLGGPWEKGMGGVAGTIKCPVCTDGDLCFSRSGYNGHIHARCSTADCVAWME